MWDEGGESAVVTIGGGRGCDGGVYEIGMCYGWEADEPVVKRGA